MYSVWSDNADLPQFEQLKGDLKTDVLIIGGGLAGILCAYELKNRGVGSDRRIGACREGCRISCRRQGQYR